MEPGTSKHSLFVGRFYPFPFVLVRDNSLHDLFLLFLEAFLHAAQPFAVLKHMLGGSQNAALLFPHESAFPIDSESAVADSTNKAFCGCTDDLTTAKRASSFPSCCPGREEGLPQPLRAGDVRLSL